MHGKGSDLNIEDTGEYTPILHAAQNGHVEVVRYLLENGVDVNSTTRPRITPFIAAAIEGQLTVMKYLMENGAEINFASKQGNTALHIASRKGFLDVVEFLDAQEDPEEIHMCAVDIARVMGHQKIIELLDEKQQQQRHAQDNKL